jgi:hypothetical protein
MLSVPVSQAPRTTITNLDPKQRLRAHIDQLPIEKQLEFVDLALHLIEERTCRGQDALQVQAELLN